jgi:hypothetical protein
VNLVSNVTLLAECTINAFGIIQIELVETDSQPAVVLITWPVKPTVCHPRRFPELASAIVRLFATASTELARIKARRLL